MRNPYPLRSGTKKARANERRRCCRRMATLIDRHANNMVGARTGPPREGEDRCRRLSDWISSPRTGRDPGQPLRLGPGVAVCRPEKHLPDLRSPIFIDSRESAAWHRVASSSPACHPLRWTRREDAVSSACVASSRPFRVGWRNPESRCSPSGSRLLRLPDPDLDPQQIEQTLERIDRDTLRLPFTMRETIARLVHAGPAFNP